MKTLYDVQEMLKKYGYINLFPDRLDAIAFMQIELGKMLDSGIIELMWFEPEYFKRATMTI